MSQRPNIFLPLHGFFQAWRTHGAQIGLQEYYALIDALQGGFGLSRDEPEKNLFHLCQMLWFNPGDSIIQFKSLFHQFYHQERENILKYVAEIEEEAAAVAESPLDPKEEGQSRQSGASGSRIERTVKDWLSADEKDSERLTLNSNQIPAPQKKGKATSEVKQQQRIKLGELVNPEDLKISEEEQETQTMLNRQFRFVPQPFPIHTDPRIVRLLFRKLFTPTSKQLSNEVDFDKTMDQFIRNKRRLGKIIYKEQPLFSAKLCILQDIGPSMSAYHKLTVRLVQLLELELEAPIQMRYFSGNLSEQIFLNKSQTEGTSLAQLTQDIQKYKLPLLILGDAGAAQSQSNRANILQTEAILKRFYKSSSKVAWLNPLPSPRWKCPTKSNAWYLRARGTPMFDMSHKGIQLAVDVLRGKRL